MSRVEVQDEEEVEGSEELQEKRVGLYALFSFHVSPFVVEIYSDAEPRPAVVGKSNCVDLYSASLYK